MLECSMNFNTYLNENGVRIWCDLQRLYPALRLHGLPQLRVDKRLTSCAGQARQAERVIQISYHALVKHYNYTMGTILAHELIHIADYDLHGPSELICGHGLLWRNMMLEYGLHPTINCVEF